MKKLTGLALISLLAFISDAHAGEDYSINMELSATRDDNLNRNIQSSNEISDVFTTAGIGIHQVHPISLFDFISYGAHIKYEYFNEVDGLNNVEATASVKYNYKPYTGFNQPVYIFSADIGVIDSATDIRDASIYIFGITLSSWITNTLSARGGASYRIKDSDSRVFDNKDARFFINADLLLNNKVTSYLTFNYINGQTVSTIDINNTPIEILNMVDPADIEFDPTFGADQLAYRFDSKTRFLTLGINYALAQKHSLDLSLRNVHSRAGGGIDYDTTQWSLSYLLSF
jgi:hypothetical protein